MEKFMKKSEEKGITLIALIITIIVLIILAGISIMMISGQDGILQRAGNAKTTIGQASAEEAVKRAILSLQIDGKGSNNGITPAKIAEQVNKDNSRSDVVAEGDTFPTNIKFVKDEIDVYVNLDLTIGEHNDTVAPGLYPIDNISESQIAPNDLFDYEPITTTGANNTKVASNGDFGSLPTKKIKITGIKSQYLNGILDDKSDTGNYGITYSKGNFTLTNTLVIPYQVEYEGEMYTVTEVDISQKVEYERNIYCVILPNIENIIYPNTVTKISYDNSRTHNTQCVSSVTETGNDVEISVQKTVILPEYITEIPDSFFGNSCIRNIKIPEQVRRIGNGAFFGCKELTSIMLPSEVNELGQGAFRQCSKLEKITILSRNLKIIEKYTFEYCSNLKKVNYIGTEEEWNSITIGDENSSLLNATIGYNYVGFPKDETEQKTLTELFIKYMNFYSICCGNISSNIRFETLQDVWNSWKENGFGGHPTVGPPTKEDYTQYNTLEEYCNNEGIEVEDKKIYEWKVGAREMDILESIPTDENEKWNKLTELFIQGGNYQMIANEEISNDTKFTSLQDVWSAWKDAGRPDNTKYNTLKEFYKSEVPPEVSIEAFMIWDFEAVAGHQIEEENNN